MKLKARYSLIIVSLIFLVVSTLAATFLFQQKSSRDDLALASQQEMSAALLAQVKKRGEVLTRFLAVSLTDALYNFDMPLMEAHLEAAQEQEDVVATYVYDEEGRIVHDGTDEILDFGELVKDDDSIQALTDEGRLVSKTVGDRLVVSLPMWVGDEPLGGVLVELSLARIEHDIAAMDVKFADIGQSSWRSTLVALSASTVLLMCVGLFLSMSVADRLIRPIHELAQTADAIGEGNYEVQIASEREDEIGELMTAFAQMATRLKQTTLSKEEVENIVGSMSDTLAVLHRDGSIRMANRAMVELLGYAHEQLEGSPMANFLVEDQGEDWESWLAAIQESKTAATIDKKYRTSSGREIPISISGSALLNRSRESEGVVCVAQDVTEWLRVQDELQHSMNAAEEASRAKSDFLATMSHEIRTPMNGVLGMSELLLKTSLDDRQRHFAKTVQRSGQALLDIINDILDFSKIEAGRLELEALDFDLQEAVEEIGELFAERAHSNGLELTNHLSRNLPRYVKGDPVRLRQVLINLVGNALKFTKEGEVVIRVKLVDEARGSTDGHLIHFEVSDTGIGIASAKLESIFDPFSQADGSTTRDYGGTGLGLAIVQRIAHAMDGDTGVESELGGGSTFWFTARFGESEVTDRDAAGWLKHFKDVRVLIVDDNSTNRLVLQERLDGWEMYADCARDGEEALAALRTAASNGDPYELAVLDMMMPGMDGLELANEIQTDSTIADVHLVMLSSVTRLGDTEKFERAGIERWLLKPVRQSQLFDCLAAVICPSEMSREASPTSPAARAGRLSMSVLVTEDQEINQQVVAAMLEGLGCRWDIAGNGRQAVEAVARISYDVVLMDCQMPVMDGFEATGLIRQAEARAPGPSSRRLPIVALTAHAVQGDREKCLAAGMDDYLPKPFTEAELHETLSRWQTGTRAEDDSTSSTAPVSVVSHHRDAREPVAEGLDAKTLSQLRELQRNGAEGLVGRVIGLYLERVPALLEDLSDAYREGESKALGRAAHALKSSSAQVGALRMVELCEEIELLARSGDVSATKELVPKLRLTFESLRPVLCELEITRS